MSAAALVLTHAQWGNKDRVKSLSHCIRREGLQYIINRDRKLSIKRNIEFEPQQRQKLEIINRRDFGEIRNSKLQLLEIKMREEEYYPPESDIRPEYIQNIKRIHSATMQKRGKIYNSMEEFLDSL